LQCCNPDGSTLDDLPTECLPIKAPQNEPESKHRCFSIPRAADTSDIGCDIQPVRQVNHYIFIITNCATRLCFKSICNYFEFFSRKYLYTYHIYIVKCHVILSQLFEIGHTSPQFILNPISCISNTYTRTLHITFNHIHIVLVLLQTFSLLILLHVSLFSLKHARTILIYPFELCLSNSYTTSYILIFYFVFSSHYYNMELYIFSNSIRPILTFEY